MPNHTLITLTNPRSAAAEAYRTLRTNIEFSSVDEQLKTLLMTSSTPTDEKSTTVANLAVVMADGGQSVILVDTDLRKPSQHTLFGLANDKGFTNLFKDEEAFDNPPLQEVTNTSLQILTSGPIPPIPSQLLTSEKMTKVMAKLSNLAQIVIFDAPPIITVNDASLLASKVDGVLMIVRANNTKRDHVQAAKDRLEKVNAHLLGAVLTNAKADAALQYN